MNRATTITFTLILIMLTVTFQASTNNNLTKGSSAISAQKWSFATGKLVYDIAEVNGLVYFTSGYGDASYPTPLYCLNASTGVQIWNYSAPYIYFTVSDGRIYIRTSTGGNPIAEGILRCLDASSGAELWQNNLNRHVSSIKVVENTLYVTSGNAIYSVDAVTGKTKWMYVVSAGVVESLFVEGGDVFTVSFSESAPYSSVVYALNVSNGQKIWSTAILNYTTLEGAYSSFSTINSELLVSQKVPAPIQARNSAQENSGSILSFDVYKGTLLWNYTTLGVSRDFIVANDTIFSTTSSGSVYAVNASNGNTIWLHQDTIEFGSIRMDGDILYVSSNKGVSCLSSLKGRVIWNYEAPDYGTKFNDTGPRAVLLPTNPAFSDGRIYFGWNGPQAWADTTTHNFYALNANNGEVIWKIPLHYAVLTAPVIVNNTLFIGCSGVTTRRPEYAGPGAVIALNVNAVPTVNPIPVDTVLAVVLVIVVLSILAVVAVVLRKRIVR
jgi:outer membrane protein assembly factor BamB